MALSLKSLGVVQPGCGLLERLCQTKQAPVDYWHAFTINPSVVRIRAGIEKIELLIEPDEEGISDLMQKMSNSIPANTHLR